MLSCRSQLGMLCSYSAVANLPYLKQNACLSSPCLSYDYIAIVTDPTICRNLLGVSSTLQLTVF